MRRDSFLTSFELALMEEPQARREKSHDDGRAMLCGVECGCGPRFIVVFQKPGEAILIIETRVKVFTHSAGMSVTQTVVKPLVIRVVETLLL